MSRCVRMDVFVVAIRYWSRSTPTYLAKDWRKRPLVEAVMHTGSVASFGSKEEAEAEAVLFVAIHPKYLGCVEVEHTVKGAIVSLRDKDE